MSSTDTAQNHIDIFFYGLHMDVERLRAKGVVAIEPRIAYLAGYCVALHRKAMLIATEGKRAAGMVCRMSMSDIQRLYRDLVDYEQVELVVTVDTAALPAISMVHRAPRLSDTVDQRYASELHAIYHRLGLSIDLLR